MKLEIETITPELAREYLQTNTTNQRSLQPNHVSFLANEIQSGKWKQNGDAIRFDKNGNLIDGQHRLNAVILSGESVNFLVIRGIEKEAFTTIDTGRKIRNTGDYLTINGESNSRELASSLYILNMIESGRVGRNATLSVSEIVDTLNKHPEIRNSMTYGNMKVLRKLVRRSICISLHYLFSRIDSGLADQFFNTLNTGMSKNNTPDAATVLRETFFRLKITNNKRINLNRWYELAITIKAWNAYIAGVVPSKYQYDSEKEKTFPIISRNVKC